MASSNNLSSIKTLQKELRELKENPVEGFSVDLINENNLYEWQVAIFGPPMTLYEGGYFKAILKFPSDYPYNPPSMQFKSKMFHPNIFESGEVCISILHSPGDDPQSGELPSERWNPTQNVRTILLSVISLLNEPNINSAAHVDASVSFRKWKESNGHDRSYESIVKHLVYLTKSDAEQDNVTVPTTLEDYCKSKLYYNHTNNGDGSNMGTGIGPIRGGCGGGDYKYPADYDVEDDLIDDDYYQSDYDDDDVDNNDDVITDASAGAAVTDNHVVLDPNTK